LGAAIGSSLSTLSQDFRHAESGLLSWRQADRAPAVPDSLKQATQLAILGAESLVRWGKLGIQAWQDTIAPAPTAAPLQFRGGEQAIATLPLLLFFHEDTTKLHLQLRQAVTFWAAPTAVEPSGEAQTEDAQGMGILGDAIAQILKHTLRPDTFLLSQLHAPPLAESLRVTLQLIQQHLETGAGLTSLREGLLKSSQISASHKAIGLALYCFLSTPEDFQLSLLQAKRTGYQTEVVCPLVGALSGAHNGMMGIPARWRFAAAVPQKALPVWERSTNEILQLADRLLAAWSGVCDPINQTIAPNQFPAIFAPGVMRPL
jgi:hypothetical protein